MRERLNLTPEEIEEARRMTPSEKIERVCELTEAHRATVRANLKARYPQASEYELKMRFAVEMLGPELAKEAYGWENPPEGS